MPVQQEATQVEEEAQGRLQALLKKIRQGCLGLAVIHTNSLAWSIKDEEKGLL
jgi:hypothetical protein